ncbi:MAG: nitrate- and nitrite sensing domain-containing protein [Polaromonas sp.]|uniref:nitrate- and nitrite sensing domain-containing protein n=1 Tax=Polaromonas sp. TaxID=1869339 RepID=UPI004035C942
MKSGLSFLIAARRCEINDLEQLTRTSALVNVVGRLVHALQKERGISNVFLSSRGVRFAGQLPAQVKECRQVEAELRASFDHLDTDAGHLSNGARLFSRIAFVLHELDALPDLRQRIADQAVAAADATAAFVKLITGLLAVVFEAADSATNPEISHLLVAMFNFMQGKEFAGQERAFGAASFASGQTDSQSQQQWLHLIQQQERCVQVFSDFSTPALRERWQNSQAAATLAELERLRRIACSAAAGALDPNLSQSWFDCCTRRIDAMKTVEDQLAADLLLLCDQKIAQARAELQNHQMILAALTSQTAPAGGAERLNPAVMPYGPHLDRSILELVQDQASRLQLMSDELETARASLNERKIVERAKGLLMAHRKLSEEEAYKMLRQTAMSQNRRLTDVAEAVLAMADYLAAGTP